MSEAASQSQFSLRHEQILEKLKRERVVEVFETFGRARGFGGYNSVRSRCTRAPDASSPHPRWCDVGPACTLCAPRSNFSARVSARRNSASGVMAARMVRDGETIILDAGTTTLAMAFALPEDLRDVVVITSSLDIAISLENNAGVTVMVTGGTVKRTGRNPRSRSLSPALCHAPFRPNQRRLRLSLLRWNPRWSRLHQRAIRRGGDQARHARGCQARSDAGRSWQDWPCRRGADCRHERNLYASDGPPR